VASFSSLDCLHGFWQPLPHRSNLLRILNNANPQTTVLVSQDDLDLQGTGALHRIETTLLLKIDGTRAASNGIKNPVVL
jgi:hypothetical protein